MKTIANRAVPILLAMGLWLMGNVLMTIEPVKGQSPPNEVPGVPSCTTHTITDGQTNCAADCSGSWSTTTDNESTCQGDSGDPQHPCMPGNGPTTEVTVSGTCHPKKVTTKSGNTYTLCVQDQNDIQTRDIPSVPQCSTSNPPPNTV